MEEVTKKQMQLHHVMSIIGGFLGGYTIFNHFDIFCNAQTGNLIKLVLNICGGHFENIVWMVLSFLVYAMGNAFYAVARKKLRVSMKIVSMIITGAALIAVGLMTGVENDFIAVLPIVFAAPVQWNAFKTAGGNSSSTMFSSNNLRQAVILLTKYFTDRDKKALRNSRFYWATLLCFHAGVAAVGLLSLVFAKHSIWFCFVLLAAAVIAYYRYENEKIHKANTLSL